MSGDNREDIFDHVANRLFPFFDAVTAPLAHRDMMDLEDALTDGLHALLVESNPAPLFVTFAAFPAFVLELASVVV